MAKRSRGQPTKLTTQVQQMICAALANAAPVVDACRMAGISLSSYYEWRAKGREGGDSRWAQFYMATEEAIATSRKVVDDRLAGYAGLLEDGQELPQPVEIIVEEDADGNVKARKKVYQPGKYTLILAQARFPETYAEKRNVQVTETPQPVGPVKLVFADEMA